MSTKTLSSKQIYEGLKHLCVSPDNPPKDIAKVREQAREFVKSQQLASNSPKQKTISKVRVPVDKNCASSEKIFAVLGSIRLKKRGDEVNNGKEVGNG